MGTPNGTNEVLASLNVPVSETSYQQTEVEVSDNDESNNSSGEDSDWMPDHETTTIPRSQSKPSHAKTSNKPGRRLKERTTSSTSSVSNGRVNKIKTIKERKKMQNVEAARRYRDKKKAEESRVGEEERKL